jgi:hypothetical protein
MKIHLVAADLFHEDGWTDMTKLIVAFHYCESDKTPNSKLYVTLVNRIQTYKATGLCAFHKY